MQRSRREIRENTPPPREIPWWARQVGGLPTGWLVVVAVVVLLLAALIALAIADVLPPLL